MYKRKYGENAPVALELMWEIDEIEQSKLSGQGQEILQFQEGFRKKQG